MPQPYRAAVMTEQGEQLISKALTEECKIEFTRVETGNGTYSEEEKKDTSLRKRTDLKSMKNSYMINDQELIEAENSIKLSMIISNIDPVTKESVVPEAYYLNEIGVYAKEHGTDNEVLFSIAVTAGDRGDLLPEYTEGQSPTEIRQTYKIAIGSTDKVYVNYEPQAYALKNDLESHKNDAIAHMTLDEKKELKRNASQTEAGRMSAADKKKLDGIDAEANKTIIDSGLSETSGNPVKNATITKELNKKATSLNLQTHTSSSVTDTEGVHGFKVNAEDKKAYAKINGTWVEIAGGGGGSSSDTTFNITTTDTSLKNKEVILYTTTGSLVTSSIFSDALSCVISVNITIGNYYIECEGFRYDIQIVSTGNTIPINFDEATQNITFTVEGANEDNISIGGNGITPVNVIFGTSQTSKSVTMSLTPLLNGKTFTFTSTVAKDTTNGTSNYVKNIAINKSTTNVKVMPDCVAYWYGNYIVSFSVDTSFNYIDNSFFTPGGTLTATTYKNKFHLHQETVDAHSIAYTSNSFINTQGKSKFCISVSDGVNNPGDFYSGVRFSVMKKNIGSTGIFLSYNSDMSSSKLNFEGIFKEDFDQSKTEFNDYIIIDFHASANNQYIDFDVNAIWCE